MAKCLLNTRIKHGRRYFELVAAYMVSTPEAGTGDLKHSYHSVIEFVGTLASCQATQLTLHQKYWPSLDDVLGRFSSKPTHDRARLHRYQQKYPHYHDELGELYHAIQAAERGIAKPIPDIALTEFEEESRA